MTLDDLRTIVESAAPSELPDVLGALEAAKARAWARLTTPPAAATAHVELVALTEEWAAARGYQFETAQKLARSGRLKGAVPAPSRGKGSRRRWLVPVSLGPAEAR